MRLQDVKPRPGAKKRRKRIGCGESSGHGKTSCKGHKGQMARAGRGIRPGFEGGQMPMHRRLPKKGFNNAQFKDTFEVVNVGEGGVPESELLVHDETNLTLANLLVHMPHPEFPMAMGVIYRQPTPSFDEAFWKAHPTGGKRTGKVADALRRASVWTKK